MELALLDYSLSVYSIHPTLTMIYFLSCFVVLVADSSQAASMEEEGTADKFVMMFEERHRNDNDLNPKQRLLLLRPQGNSLSWISMNQMPREGDFSRRTFYACWVYSRELDIT